MEGNLCSYDMCYSSNTWVLVSQLTKCVDCNKEIEQAKVHRGSLDREPRCVYCSDRYEGEVYAMTSDW